MSKGAKELAAKLSSFKYVLIVAAVGLLLLLWPSESIGEDAPEASEEARIAAMLARIEGVGEVEVLLSESGAVVVCRGAEDASVCLRVSQAVRCYTGLGADKVEIFKME